MKKIAFLILFVLLVIVSCTPKPSVTSPLEGAWHVITFRQMHGDTVVMQLGKDFTGSEMKIWAGNHFGYVGQYKMADSTLDNFGGGSFTLNGNRYDEIKTYPSPVTVKLLLEIKNDTITQTWPVDDNGQVIKSNYYIQKLTRNK